MARRLALARNIVEKILIAVAMIVILMVRPYVKNVYMRRMRRMSENEIKDLIQTELREKGYMYTLGMLKGMYKAGAFNAVEWATLAMYLDDLNIERLG